MKWISVEERLPDAVGWYKIKTPLGEYEACYGRTMSEKLVWVVPDPSFVTHWMPSSEPNVQASVATDDQSSNEADKPNQTP